jgi:glutamine synthetase
VLTGNAYEQDGDPLPVNWAAAIEQFGRSDFARICLGEKFVSLFTTVKRAEMEEFNTWITPLEIERYLGPL